ncbi:amino acid adenylation domain-containing protein, partial [Nocardia sp. R7R-8]|uniref:amino acid adenylation domain-containing protein n=1 Tax=Nocardia sp. R7R-8 TaxID=3459304 RepID=UPI00403E32A7
MNGAPSTATRTLASTVRPDRIPLSLAQTRMWFLNRLDPSSAAYHIPLVLGLEGLLDVAALSSAIVDLLERNESLRTRFPDGDAGPHQTVVDVSALPRLFDIDDVAPNSILGHINAFVNDSFDLCADLPIRCRLLRMSDRSHVLVIVAHHIAVDGLSLKPLSRDLIRAYQARRDGAAPDWEPLDVQYADYALWQRAALGDEDDEMSETAIQARFWRKTFATLPDTLNLPTSYPRPHTRAMVGGMVHAHVDPVLTEFLDDLAHSQGATRFMVFHAALAALLSRLTGSCDVTIGTPLSGRTDPRLEELVGMFVNTVALRTTVDLAQPLAELLTRCRDHDLEAFTHGDLPFDRVVELVNPPRTTSHTPLFQVILAFEDDSQFNLDLPGLAVEPLDRGEHAALFDLEFTITADGTTGSPLQLILTYATDIFDEPTARSLVDQFLTMLRAMGSHPATRVGDVDLVTAARAHHLVPCRGAEPSNTPSLRALLDLAVRQAADRDAVCEPDRSISYAELDARSTDLARGLSARSIGPASVVAILVHRSIELQIAIWAVVKTGAAFLPIEPSLPAERIASILSDAHANLVLTTAAAQPGCRDSVTYLRIDETQPMHAYPHHGQEQSLTPREPHPLDTAYLIYTSGSTGRPKGVAVTGAGVANLAEALRTQLPLGMHPRVLNAASPGFDAYVLEMLLALGSLGTLVVSAEALCVGDDLTSFIRRERIDCAFLTPSVLNTVDASDTFLRTVIVGGEQCPRELVDTWAPSTRMFNAYGPTEATVATVVSGPLTTSASWVPIGRPLPGTSAIVLDARLQPVSPGVIGELYLAGVQLAEGYRGLHAQTATHYVADPFGEPGERMYRTGDLARWHHDGQLEYVGRADSQVKIRGLRIELGEIEHTLVDHPGILASVATTREFPGGTVVAAFVVPYPGQRPDPAELRAHCAQRLPEYMVPYRVAVLDELPLTTSGKVDHARLPGTAPGAAVHRAPVTPVQQVIADTFADVLEVARVGLDDDFFELGGNSLSATRLAARLSAALDAAVPVRSVFDHPTVDQLGATLTMLEAGHSPLPEHPVERPERLPLSFAQSRMWFLSRFTDSAAYHIPLFLRLIGRLDVEALRAALADLVDRHEPLRTTYPAPTGQPMQVILPVGEVTPNLPVVDVDAAELDVAIDEFASLGFDLEFSPPFRCRLFRHSNDDHVLAVVLHHIAADGSSMAVLGTDLMHAYQARRRGMPVGWAPLHIQYADHALWQRSALGTVNDAESVLGTQLAHWREVLSGAREVLALPLDRPRPARQSFRGAAIEFDIDALLGERLDELARAHGATVFMLLHTALAVLLAHWSGEHDIVIGTAAAGRGDERLDGMVGMFVNSLVLRCDVPMNVAFNDLLRTVVQSDVDAFDNADIPFEALVDQLRPNRSGAHSPLFQVMLAYQNFRRANLILPDLTVSEVETPVDTTRFDLEFAIFERAGEGDAQRGPRCILSYATDLFDEVT